MNQQAQLFFTDLQISSFQEHSLYWYFRRGHSPDVRAEQEQTRADLWEDGRHEHEL